jgi:hypothetical protein
MNIADLQHKTELLAALEREIGHAQGLIESEWGSRESELDNTFEALKEAIQGFADMAEKSGAELAASNAEYSELFEKVMKPPTIYMLPQFMLYAWQPRGHGEPSFFVCAESEDAARAAVESDIKRRMAIPWDNDEKFERLDSVHGWGTDYYDLTVAPVGRVIANDND